MKVLIGDRGKIDFQKPIKMSPNQRQRFIQFMLDAHFSVVEEEESDRIRRDRLGDKNFYRLWTNKELSILLDMYTREEVCEKLGRSEMSVNIRRGIEMPKYILHAKEVGLNPEQLNDEERIALIADYIEERKRERNKKSKNIRDLKRSYEINLKRLDTMNLNIKCKFDLQESLAKKAELEKELIEIRNKIIRLNPDWQKAP